MSSGKRPVPQRTCVGCGKEFDQDRLIRLVASPEGMIEIDYGRRLPGRGAYLFPNRSCFERAQGSKGFFRALKRKNLIFETERLWENLKRINRERLLQDLALANKAGAAVSGGNNVAVELKRGKRGILLIAEDASDNSRDRFESKGRGLELTVLRALSRDEIGHALGKAPRAVVLVVQQAFADKIIRDGAIYEAISHRVDCQFERGRAHGQTASI